MKRKLMILLFIPILCLAIAGCSDKKLDDKDLNVLFYVDNGTPVATVFNVEKGDLIEEPEDPVRFGHIFGGWYKDSRMTNPWDFAKDTVESSVVLYAKWISEIWRLNYVLTTELSEEYLNPSAVKNEVKASENYNLPGVRRPGGNFKGWILVPYSEYNLSMPYYNKFQDLPLKSSHDFTLYPLFDNQKSMIQFNTNMPNVPKPPAKTGIEFGSIINFPVLNNTETHIFIGWFTKNGTSDDLWGTQLINGEYFKVNSTNVVVHAKWQEK